MIEKDVKEFANILDFLAEGLGVDMTANKYKFYFAALSDLTIDEIKKAANHIARTATFFPKPVDFRNAVSGNIDGKVVEAWEKVQKAKSRAGQYQSVQFDDPVIHSTLKLMGGWGAVCRLEGHDDEKWQRIDFEKTYKAIAGQKKDHPNYLPGAAEVQNGAMGHDHKQEVMQIGQGKPVIALMAPEKPKEIGMSKVELSNKIKSL